MMSNPSAPTKVKRVLALWRAPVARLARTFDGRDLHLYGGLALLGYALVGGFGSVALAVPGALLFALGVFGLRDDKKKGGG